MSGKWQSKLKLSQNGNECEPLPMAMASMRLVSLEAAAPAAQAWTLRRCSTMA